MVSFIAFTKKLNASDLLSDKNDKKNYAIGCMFKNCTYFSINCKPDNYKEKINHTSEKLIYKLIDIFLQSIIQAWRDVSTSFFFKINYCQK